MGRVLMTYADASKHKNRSRTDCPAPVLLPAVGLEPTRGYPQQILSQSRTLSLICSNPDRVLLKSNSKTKVGL